LTSGGARRTARALAHGDVDILTREPGGARRIDYARFHDVVPLATPRGE